MRFTMKALALAATTTMLGAGPALACGGLVAPNGAVNLVRTTTLAAYRDGVEHYVTSFEFAGSGAGKFGSIVPLPAVPTEVSKGGRWTLQRLVEEVRPPVARVALLADGAAAESQAKVLLETRVSALDITVLEGGGDEVGSWAQDNGFSLPPDAPEVLDFYARRSPVFMAVRYNLERASERELRAGDGIPVHVTIPTDRPWLPLRILALGREPQERVSADVFLLTEREPSLLPQAEPPGSAGGVSLERSGLASDDLLRDLRGDRGMAWMPSSGMWLDHLVIDTPASALDHDLAINVSGSEPSPVDAGLELDSPPTPLSSRGAPWWPWLAAAVLAAVTLKAVDHLAPRRG